MKENFNCKCLKFARILAGGFVGPTGLELWEGTGTVLLGCVIVVPLALFQQRETIQHPPNLGHR